MRAPDPERQAHIRRLGGLGILTEADIDELSAGCFRVFLLMADREWHDAVEIRNVADGSEGLRRLRELRPPLDNLGFGIEKIRSDLDSRLFRYRIAIRCAVCGVLSCQKVHPEDNGQRNLF